MPKGFGAAKKTYTALSSTYIGAALTYMGTTLTYDATLLTYKTLAVNLLRGNVDCENPQVNQRTSLVSLRNPLLTILFRDFLSKNLRRMRFT